MSGQEVQSKHGTLVHCITKTSSVRCGLGAWRMRLDGLGLGNGALLHRISRVGNAAGLVVLGVHKDLMRAQVYGFFEDACSQLLAPELYPIHSYSHSDNSSWVSSSRSLPMSLARHGELASFHTHFCAQLTMSRPAILIGLFVAFGGVLFGFVASSFHCYTMLIS